MADRMCSIKTRKTVLIYALNAQAVLASLPTSRYLYAPTHVLHVNNIKFNHDLNYTVKLLYAEAKKQYFFSLLSIACSDFLFYFSPVITIGT